MNEDKIKEKIQQFEKEGKLELSSTDISAPVVAEQEDIKKDETNKTSILPASDKPLTDGLLQAGRDNGIRNQLFENLNSLSFFDPKEVEITKEDKEAFIEALITGDRLIMPFSVYGGKVTGTIRARKHNESSAVVAFISKLSKQSELTTAEYSAAVREILLVIQLDSLNEIKFSEITHPLVTTVVDGKLTDVGWLNQKKYFENMTEALISTLYRQILIFETKYWTMVDAATNQNFWSPAESI